MTRRKTALLSLIGAALLAATPARTCALDDCTLPEAFHRDDTRLSAPADRFAWMNHDLAELRTQLRHGERSAALALGLELGRSLEAHKHELAGLRGESRVRWFHASIDEAVRRAGGWGLAPLELSPSDEDGTALAQEWTL